MEWSKKYYYSPRYKYISTNQHGDRYKVDEAKQVSVAVLEAKRTNAVDMEALILLSHHLDVPVRYDFDTNPHTAFIEVIGKEAL